MVMSDFSPEVEIRLFRIHNASGHNYWNSSLIMDVAMGQIPRSTECISSFCYIDMCYFQLMELRTHSLNGGKICMAGSCLF